MTRVFLIALAAATALAGQTVPVVRSQSDPMSSARPYLLGPGDQIQIRASNAEEIGDKPYRIENDGTILLPLLGKVKPAGQTVEQFEESVTGELAKYVRNPQVTVSVVQFRSEPVTFAGLFRTPGVYNLQGGHSLTEMLAVAGGLDPAASRVLRIARRKDGDALPVPNARLEADGRNYVGTIDVSAVPGEQNLSDKFILMPFDVVTALPGDPIYISGEVVRVGTVGLGDRSSLTLGEVLAISGGLTKEASKHIKVYRPLPDSTQKKEIVANFDRIQKGQEPDVQLLPKDMVVVGRATGKAMAIKAAGIATGLGTGVILASHY